MKNPNNLIGNRTRDLHALSAVPQPTESPRIPSPLTITPHASLTKEKKAIKETEAKWAWI
jgi:hypothetical protein